MKLELTKNDILLVKLACSALIAFFMIRFLLMPGIERLQENGIQNAGDGDGDGGGHREHPCAGAVHRE